MLTNSLLAGALGAAYLTVLVLQLNPHVPVISWTTSRWFTTLGVLYGLHLAVIFYVVMVVREFFALDVLSPGWASVRVLAWLAAASTAVASLLMWLNLAGFTDTLTPDDARRMLRGTLATSASAVVLLVIAIAHYSYGRRGSRVAAGLFTLATCASLALPLAARGPAAVEMPALWPADVMPDTPADLPPPAGPRVTMLLLDGASLDYIWPRVAEGRLPHFSRLLDAGASMYLATVRPTQANPAWASIATGMYPAKTGVRSAAVYYARGDGRAVELLPDHCLSHALVHLGFIREEPRSSESWRARPLWSILSGAGIPVGIVRWPLTHPAAPVNGFVVTDQLHRLAGSITEFNRSGQPAAILPSLQAALAEPPLDGGVLPFVSPGGSSPEATAQQRDQLYGRVMRRLRAAMPPRFSALRYEGLDTVGHHYLRYTQPQRFRSVPEEDRRRYTQIIDRYYAFIDAEVGLALDGLAPGDLLVVVSAFGMQPLNPLKRGLGRLLGDPDLSGTHERAPDGFLLAYGTAVNPGRQQRGSIVDVAPTLLYFLGLPVARDMDGFARTDLFTREFTAERPIAFIGSYGR